MKSRLFSYYDATRSEEMKKDLSALLLLSGSQLNSLAAAVPAVYTAQSPLEDRNQRLAVAKQICIDFAVLDHAFDIGKFFIRCFMDPDIAEGDLPVAITDDLQSLGFLPKEKTEEFACFLSKIQSAAVQIKATEKKLRYAQRCLPSLDEVEVVVEHRCVFEPEFKFIDNPSDYKPACTGVVPIAILSLGVAGGHHKEFVFQTDRRQLQILINCLEAAKKQLDVSEKYLNLK